MTQLIIHGHFYQPPRENPWTGQIDAEPSAAPFHDWNERIHGECYAPNTAVPVAELGAGNFVNNYARISFDFGPTLLSWLEQHHAETYAQVIAADRQSAKEHGGHGNAIAQAYNHAILPLCNERDRRTQVRWGLADFSHRFGRAAESMWLPETACNDGVLGLLIDEGLRFVVLAPQQATRVRVAGHDWQDVADQTVDPSIPYNYNHRDGSGRSLAIFFYDHHIAHSIAFEQALGSSTALVKILVQRSHGAGDLVNAATDGESYGHHHKFGDLCLAHALEIEAPANGFSLTNYGEYLDSHPAMAEVEISNGSHGEGSSWSCTHGVSRWIRDCGCHTGGDIGWNQAWRRPLREALDYLRDTGAIWFEGTRGELFADPWVARDEAIYLILNPTNSEEAFLNRHAPRLLNTDDQMRALLFLEMQRHLLLMYTSCGWFFNDISGIEPVQILKYACRAIDIMDQLKLPSPRRQFLNMLAEAKSNRPEMGNGADIYERLVEPLNPSWQASDANLSLRAG